MAAGVDYEFVVATDLDPESAEARTRELLLAEGFGVLTEIDVRATLKAKLGAEFRPYKILGACNPELALRALSIDAGVGVLLPCNVVIEADSQERATVRFMEPAAALSIVGNPAIGPIAADASARLHRVAQRLRQGV